MNRSWVYLSSFQRLFFGLVVAVCRLGIRRLQFIECFLGLRNFIVFVIRAQLWLRPDILFSYKVIDSIGWVDLVLANDPLVQ